MSGSEPGPRATVDTNLFVSGAISPTGAPRRLLRAWTAGRFRLVLSADHHAELADVFARPKLVKLFRIDPADLAEILAGLATIPQVTPAPSTPPSRPRPQGRQDPGRRPRRRGGLPGDGGRRPPRPRRR